MVAILCQSERSSGGTLGGCQCECVRRQARLGAAGRTAEMLILTRFYKGFRETVSFSRNGKVSFLGAAAASGIPVGAPRKHKVL